jgi:pyruvate/2-oxoglutarate dehydrogenase complex dihydrolipoamide acyltransferase (E2) component
MSTIRAIEIPKWGMTMDEGTVDEWHIAEGDSFLEGDLLVAIESTKVMNDLAASFDGTLRRIVAQSGDVLPVGALIGVSADQSVSDEEIDAYVAEHPTVATILREAPDQIHAVFGNETPPRLRLSHSFEEGDCWLFIGIPQEDVGPSALPLLDAFDVGWWLDRMPVTDATVVFDVTDL